MLKINITAPIAMNVELPSIEGRLKKLDSLYNQGLITRDEYDEKRKQIFLQYLFSLYQHLLFFF